MVMTARNIRIFFTSLIFNKKRTFSRENKRTEEFVKAPTKNEAERMNSPSPIGLGDWINP